MSDGDDMLSKRYRDLAREEPPSALDATILAASRRAVAKPSFSRRWGVPVSIAAVLVLGFGVTLEMEHEKPGVSTSVPVPAPAATPVPVPAGVPPLQLRYAPEAATKVEAPRATGNVRSNLPSERKAVPLAKERAARDEMQAAPAVAPLAAPAPPAAQSPAAPPPSQAPSADYNAAPAAAATARAKSSASALESASAKIVAPEQELEGIATLRAKGQDDEADRALADFLRRYPGYRIPDTMWERVKPR